MKAGLEFGPGAVAAHGGTRPYVVLAVLTLVALFNYVDRYLLSILVEPVRADLGLSDTQVGLVTGLGFALFYSVLAIPAARIAERRGRRRVIAAGCAIWSLGTLACSAASGFGTLLLGRMLVGAGESGAIAPSMSILSDVFPPGRRGTAMAVFGMGGAIGSAAAALLGGWLGGWVGWRWTFAAVASLGVPITALLLLFVREPPFGFSEGVVAAAPAPPLFEALRRLFGRPTFRILTAALICLALNEYCMVLWMPAFFQRSFGISALELGTRMASFQGMPLFLGTLTGGLLVDRLAGRDARWFSRIPAAGALIAAPAVALLFTISDLDLALLALVVPSFVTGLYVSPTYSLLLGLAASHSRTTATAVMTFAINLFGAGLGPLCLGLLSDSLASGFGAESLRYAFFTMVPLYLAGAALLMLAGKTSAADLADARAETMGEQPGR